MATGRLTVHYPTVAGQKVVILASDLLAWIESSPTRRDQVVRRRSALAA
jgi:hypothetical protein